MVDLLCNSVWVLDASSLGRDADTRQLWTQYQGHRSPVSHSGEKSPKCDPPLSIVQYEKAKRTQSGTRTLPVMDPVQGPQVIFVTTHLTREEKSLKCEQCKQFLRKKVQ